MTITSILELPIEIVEKIIDLVDDRNSLLGLATITHLKDIIYKRLFPKLNILHNRNDSIHGKFISFYCISKFLNFLDDSNNYVPNEILTNIDTLYELFEIKHINFKDTKINLIIHPYHTIEDLEFSFKNFKINSIILKPDFDYQLTGKHYDKTLYLSQLENENFRKLTFPDTLEKFDMGYNNLFLRNSPHSLRELNLTEIDDLNSIKLPLSLRSLSLTDCKIRGVMLDLSYLYRLKNFESQKTYRVENDLSSKKLKLPLSIESICLLVCDFRSLNNLSDYKNLKVFKLKRCGGSILLFNTILPHNLERLQIESIYQGSVRFRDIMSHGEAMNLSNVTIKYPPEDQPEADLWYEINGGNIFPSSIRILKLTDIACLELDFQLNLPNLEELELSYARHCDIHNLINENLVNLRKLTVRCCSTITKLIKFPKNLEYISLQDYSIDPFIPLTFIHLDRLEHLIIRDYPETVDEDPVTVSDNHSTSITEQIAPNLKILDISFDVNKLCHQKNLEKLILTTSAKADDIYINNLKSLKLTIKAVHHLNKSSKFLDYKFDSCYFLRELILRLEIDNISNLTFPDTVEILDITCKFSVTKMNEDDLQKDLYNISNCHNLKNFKLKFCNIEYFNFDNLPKNLEDLSITYSKLKSIHGSLKSLTKLKSLNLKSNKINNRGLKSCLFSSPNIEIIYLNGNFINNLDCVRVESCPRLIELNLKMDSRVNLYITDEFEEELKLTCPRLSFIRGYKKINKKSRIVYGSNY
ncbi:uncharacterized protein KGF55_005312 [Candida pseudojiufengensis]|uniref:uncharacterized protein n=1 Tax=Candida pseudojiufengensis TaxID=497109 RepID=UPI002224FFFE|nr:uncharacterized protein KGF55_005312 [Candida pseudojiufengensis]KAI5959484.1 hypothetical protein KGF55_005312 [Candida pseudojiufengensis]